MGGGGGQQNSTTTTSIDPAIKPYVTYGLEEAKRLYETGSPQFFPGQTYVSPSEQTQQALQMAKQRAIQGSPLTGAAQEETLATIQGRGVNPFLAGALSGTNRLAGEEFNRNIQNLQSSAASAGRYNSSAMGQQVGQAQDIFARNLLEAGNRMAYQSAEAERQRQVDASRIAPQMAQSDYMDINQLAKLGQITEGYKASELQDAMNRFNFQQNLPQMKLQQYANLYSSAPQGSTTVQTATPTGGK